MAAGKPGRVLVTGAGGLLGRAVVEDLLAAGHEVEALDRAPARLPEGARFLSDDLGSRERIEALLAGTRFVVHCAAWSNPHLASEEVVFGGNVTSTANLLFAAEAVGVERLVYASSQSALGLAYAASVTAPDYLPVDEDHPCRPGEGYGLSKLIGEQLCALVAQRSRLRIRSLRLPVIWALERFAAHVGKRLGDPAQAARSQWSYIDVRDAARACRLALFDAGTELHAVYNIAAPWPFAMPEPAATLRERYGEVPQRAGWTPGDAVFATSKAEAGLGFRARWRWTEGGIEDSLAKASSSEVDTGSRQENAAKQ